MSSPKVVVATLRSCGHPQTPGVTWSIGPGKLEVDSRLVDFGNFSEFNHLSDPQDKFCEKISTLVPLVAGMVTCMT